jgi:hypothetical protein
LRFLLAAAGEGKGEGERDGAAQEGLLHGISPNFWGPNKTS